MPQDARPAKPQHQRVAEGEKTLDSRFLGNDIQGDMGMT